MDDESMGLLGDSKSGRCGCMQKLCYGLGHVYNDLCAAIWFSYTLFYFQIVLEIQSTTAGTLIMIGQVADSLATPTAGWAMDRTGAPQAWHLAGTVAVAVGFSFVFSLNPGSNHWWSLLYYGGLVIVFQIGWAIVQISHLSVIPAISRDLLQSADLTAIRYTASVCCNIFVYLLTWMILENGSVSKNIGPDDFYKFKDIVLIITGIGIFCTVIFYCGVRTTRENVMELMLENGSSTNSLLTKEKINNKHFLKSCVIYLVSLMYMSSRLCTILNLIYVPLYLEERDSEIGEESEGIRSAIASVPLASFCASFLTSIILKYRTERCTDKIVYLIGSIFSLSGSLWIALGVPLGSYFEIYAIVCFTGIGSSATMISSLCLTAEFVKTNGFGGASVYSTVTFTDKLVSGGVVLIIQHLQCLPKDECPYFYEYVLAFAGGAAATLGVGSLLLLHYQNINAKQP